MIRLSDKAMLCLVIGFCITVFATGAAFSFTAAQITPRLACGRAESGKVVVIAENCDGLAQHAFMRLLFIQAR
jgi:hypothetical protein